MRSIRGTEEDDGYRSFVYTAFLVTRLGASGYKLAVLETRKCSQVRGVQESACEEGHTGGVSRRGIF